jgi:hypothetical protein
VWSFCFDQHNADIAFTRVMDSLPKTFRKPQVEPVEWRIGKNDAPDSVVAFEPDALHGGETPLKDRPSASAHAAYSILAPVGREQMDLLTT